jgi:hypothetical protein
VLALGALCFACADFRGLEPKGEGISIEFQRDIQQLCEGLSMLSCMPYQPLAICETDFSSEYFAAEQIGCGDAYEAMIRCWSEGGLTCGENGKPHLADACEPPGTAFLNCQIINSASAAQAPSALLGDAGAEPAFIATTVRDEDRLSSLAGLERDSLCRELTEAIFSQVASADFKRAVCTQEAWEGRPSFLPYEDCEDIYSDCMSLPETDFLAIRCDSVVSLTDECTEAGTLRSCYSDYAEAVERALSEAMNDLPLTCSEAREAGDPKALPHDIPIAVPASCLDACENACGGCRLPSQVHE